LPGAREYLLAKEKVRREKKRRKYVCSRAMMSDSVFTIVLLKLKDNGVFGGAEKPIGTFDDM